MKRKGFSSQNFNVLTIRAHGVLRLAKSPVPGGRLASSIDLCAIPVACRAVPDLSTNKSGKQTKRKGAKPQRMRL
jgi:hypothetical protein